MRKGHVTVLQPDAVGLAVGVHGEVPHVAGVVAFGIFEAMFLVSGIEVSAGRFEIGAIALANSVEMDGVLPRRQVVEMKLDFDPRTFLRQRRHTQAFSLTILQFNLMLKLIFGGAGRRQRERKQA